MAEFNVVEINLSMSILLRADGTDAIVKYTTPALRR